MKKQYPYSVDKEFLSKIDALRIKEQWVKITLLEYSSEVPLESIEGKITSGNLNKAGDSAVRRTCNLTATIDTFKYNLDDIKANYSISKKIYLELGISNTTDEYIEEKIVWFPQGIFFITNFSIAASSTGAASINLQFKDKMAQLDGTVGGVLPATTRFDTVTTIIDDIPITKKELVYNIIMEAVHHFGGEDLSNIIIDDIPNKAKRIIRWMGSSSVWIYPILGQNNEISYDICFTSDLDEKQSAHTPVIYNDKVIGAKEYKPNEDIGYMYEDFVYDEELTFNAGTKITEVLDKIKNWLGNYEYFYDEWGQFHFQEIKNYLNNSQSSEIWDKVVYTDDLDYLYESTQGKTVYTFDDNINLISITNTPVYENIKNDFIVEGMVNNNNIKYPCRYHLVIDDKPTITQNGYDNILIYTDSLNNTTITRPEIIEPIYDSVTKKYSWSLPEFADGNKIYGLLDEPKELILKKQLKKMEDFEECYNNLATKENILISKDNQYVLTDEIKEYLFALLENYMGRVDSTAYKTQYREIISTLARQLNRYNVQKQHSSLSTTIEYYENLYSQYMLDIGTYGQDVVDMISWCGELLQLLYNLFSDINSIHRPSDRYKDSLYWPQINIIVPELWHDMSFSEDKIVAKNQRRIRCIKLIDNLKIKQKQINILIEQYTQIINNYNVQIAVYNRKTNLTSEENNSKNEIIENINVLQNQINNFKEEQETCSERLTILYAILTALGFSDSVIGNTYYTIDITIPARITSFWCYNTDDSKDNYGWQEVQWYKYYKEYIEDISKTYYPDGIGSMTYIDYLNFNWENSNFNNNEYFSMNCYSDWYQNIYIDYAIENNLSYFDKDEINRYIPLNWRTELLLMGLQAEENGTDPGYYYQELKACWPQVYDFKLEQLSSSGIDYINYFVGSTGVIIGDEYQFETNDFDAATAKAKFNRNNEAEIEDFMLKYENGSYYYFFDMIDSSSPTWGEYSVKNIGRRLNVNIDDSVNCIFAPHIPNYAFINVSNLTLQERQEIYAELKNISEDIIQVTDVFYNNFATGGLRQSAYEQIKYDLQQHTSYQNTVSVTAIPCFYLEPNVRVKLNDHSTNTFGDYVIKTISIPLGTNSNMSVSMSKAMERI